MAEDNEKKNLGDMNAEELENVAGGWCLSGGISKPKGVDSITTLDNGGGYTTIVVKLKDGNETHICVDSNGKLLGSGDVHNNIGAAPPIR